MEREEVKLAARYRARGFTVSRFVIRTAYPRNGNVGRGGTKEYSYSLYQHGRLVGGGYPRLRECTEMIDFILNDNDKRED